ncbi:unnamed protein product, partial [Oppiella nova]
MEYSLNVSAILRHRNCEYYCTLWKYGKGWSTQVTIVEMSVGVTATGVGVGAVVVGAVIGGSTAIIAIPCGLSLLLAVMAYFGVKWLCPEKAIGVQKSSACVGTCCVRTMGSVLSTGSVLSPMASFGTHPQIYEVVNRGDIIEIQMSWGYKHWVICEYKSGGNVWCYHLAPGVGSSAAKMFLRKVPLLDIL